METELQEVKKWKKLRRLGGSSALLLPTFAGFNQNSDVRTKSILEKVDNSSGYGSGCRRLILYNMNYHLADYVALSKHFPNVTHFSFTSDDERPSQGDKPYTPDQQLLLQNWRNSLESINVNVRRRDLVHLFDSGLFHSLKSLKLNIGSCDFDFFPEFLARADNLPHLTEVSFDILDIWDLEIMHQKLPRLSSLTLHYGLKSEKQVPLDVQPSTSLETLHFPLWLRLETPECVQYLASKYCRVKHLLLRSYRTRRDPEYLKQRDETLSQFLPLVGDHLKTLELNVHHRSNVFRLLDLSRLEVMKADLFLSKRRIKSIFCPSKGLHAIRNLTLEEVPPINFNVFDRLEELTTLSLNFREKMGQKFTMSLNTVLNRHFSKKLESLQLGFVEITIDSNDALSFDSKIKALTLKRCEVSDKLPNYLTQHMKEMDSFSFHSSIIVPRTRSEVGSWRRILQDSDKHLFELPDHHLSTLEIYLRRDYSHRYSHMSYREDCDFPTKLQLSIGMTTSCFDEKGMF
jgi:hypothetical protein